MASRLQVVLVAALACDRASGAKEDDSWTVVCNVDCEGVNTCEQKQLCAGEELETGACTDNPECAVDDRCPPVSCSWGQWEEWQNDGISGLCERSRSFTPNRCGGSPCIGTVSDTIYCDPVKRLSLVRDCVFAQWEEWTSCDPATLQRTRNRSVAVEAAYGGRSCAGPMMETEPCGERLGSVDCKLGDWMAWSGCSRTCGGGQHHRMRAIKTQAERGGTLCGEADDDDRILHLTESCNMEACSEEHQAQDCMFDEWAEWSQCFGREHEQYRERKVLRPGGWGGMTCSGELKSVRPCVVKHSNASLPVDCKLSAWTPWTLCTRTCEGGQTSRERHIEAQSQNGGKPCADITQETNACNEFPCAMDPESRDCSLSMWAEWSGCSTQCGQGLQMRSRMVRVQAMPGGLGCSDPLEEARPCENTRPCDHVDCEWGLWSRWSACSLSCGGGFRQRSREVVKQPSRGGHACQAFENISEVLGCNTEPCYEECVDGTWADWQAWSGCSRSCGGGLEWRNRQVERPASPCGVATTGLASEERGCNPESCDGDQDCRLAEWAPWSTCSRTCDGVTSRTRLILTMNKGAGKWCSENVENVPLEEIQACNAAKDIMERASSGEPGANEAMQACGFEGHEPVDCLLDQWQPWSDCSTSCDGGQQERKRKIIALPENGGRACTGALEELGPCAEVTCVAPEDCVWGSWSSWSQCSTCDGERTRVRHVARQGNSKGKLCESGPSKELQRCDDCAGYKTMYCVWNEWLAGECSVTCGTGGWRKEVRMLVSTDKVPEGGPHMAVGHVKGPDARCDGSEVNFTRCGEMPMCANECARQDCEFSEWSDWSSAGDCQGLCTRSRGLLRNASCGGDACHGELAETEDCEEETCPVSRACELSDWGSWTPCEEDEVQRKRNRHVAVPAGPEGKPCNGTLQETAPCASMADEVADCTFTSWDEWSGCSATCGEGNEERTREILSHAVAGGAPCKGPLQIARTCSSAPCGPQSQDCTMGEWEAWSQCDAKHDVASRKRSITMPKGNGKPCNGTLMEAGPCHNPKAVDCVWAEWAPWGSCGKVCGGGQRFRTREVSVPAQRSGKPCDGEIQVTETCNTEPCSEQDCLVSEWGLWSECRTNCGQGQQVRERAVIRAAQVGGNGCLAELTEARGCLQEGGQCVGDRDCVWATWSDWSDCFQAEYCGVGYKRRKRAIEVPPEGVGAPCTPVATEEVQPFADCPGSCDSRSCVDGEWAEWDEWSGCSVTCGGGGLRSRTRALEVEANDCGKAAEGEDVQEESCHAPSCSLTSPLKQDCIFGAWTAWLPPACPAMCNGEQKRTRTIVRYSSNGGEPCVGATSEVTRCNPSPGQQDPPGCTSGAPVDCVLQDWSRWSECSAECGTGHRARRRNIAQTPQFAGMTCENPLEEIQECNASKPCVDWSMDCKWADWEDWSRCHAMTGQKKRARSVLQLKAGFGEDCQGPQSEVANCTRACQDKPYVCEWAPWSVWSGCTMTCGPEGRRTRLRQLQLGGEAAVAASPASVKPAELGQPEVAAAGTPPMPRIDDQETIQRYSDLRARLATVTQHRHHDLGMCFFGGLASFLVVFGLAQFATRTKHRSRRNLTVHNFSDNDVLHADLAARLQSEQRSP